MADARSSRVEELQDAEDGLLEDLDDRFSVLEHESPLDGVLADYMQHSSDEFFRGQQ